MTITDDMVRRAINAYDDGRGGCCEFDWMRAALTAALSDRSPTTKSEWLSLLTDLKMPDGSNALGQSAEFAADRLAEGLAALGCVAPMGEEGLHPDTAALVRDFAAALAAKLRKSEIKYGYTNGWLTQNWAGECHAHLYDHLDKGDPLDAAAYCAFMWRRGWSTISVPTHMRKIKEKAAAESRQPAAGAHSLPDRATDDPFDPAAIRNAAIEEAAQIAENNNWTEWRYGANGKLEHAPQIIANAIRSLKSSPTAGTPANKETTNG